MIDKSTIRSDRHTFKCFEKLSNITQSLNITSGSGNLKKVMHFYSGFVYLGCYSVLFVCLISLSSEGAWLSLARVLCMKGPVLVTSPLTV